MNNSIWQDEAQLANMFQEEELNSSSESSSPGFHFRSAQNLKRNLKETFDRELPQLSNSDQVDYSDPNHSSTSFFKPRSEDPTTSTTLPPLPSGFVEKSKTKKSKKKFSVYLRIRPLPLRSSKYDSQGKGKGKAAASTIEILKPASDSKHQTSFPTAIRTYPPDLSNVFRMNVNRQARDNSAYAKEFNFDRVMGPDTSQESVYSTVAAPMIQDLLGPQDMSTSMIRDNSALLFSYGITNAGKTHTILGDMNSTNQANWGVIPRVISDIFQRNIIQSKSGNSAVARFDSREQNRKGQPSCNMYISFFEIYNENVYDLMPSNTTSFSKKVSHSPPALKVRECRGQIFIRGLARHKINTIKQGFELTKIAHNKRHTSSNNLNSDSSRSHFICQIKIVPLEQTAGSASDREFATGNNVNQNFSSHDTMDGYPTDEEATIRSKHRSSTVWIVDLAGSERSKRTRVGSTRQKESTKINNSLMILMRCLNAMKKDGKKGFGKNVIPFRESKLTHIFMHHLTSESAARTAMMVNVNPSVDDFDETQHVLAYSRKAKLIEIDMKEYGMKRKELFGEEYDQNGRKRPRIGEHVQSSDGMAVKKQKDTILSRIAKKLSPKKVTGNHPSKNQIYRENNTSSANYSHIEEIETLKRSLRLTKERISRLENQNVQLLQELDNKEDQIRIEVSMEMEKRLRETRANYNERYEHLRSVMGHQATKTDISVSMDRAEIQLEELMDKIDECENEMVRMSQEHAQVVTALNKQIEELQRREKIAATERKKDGKKIHSLEEALKKTARETTQSTGAANTNTRGRDTQSVPKDEDVFKATKFKRQLRPRKPLGNSTNQTMGSRVFAMDTEY